MGTTATIIAISYLVVVVLGSALALVLVRSTRTRKREADTAKLARREKAWLGIVIAMLVALLFATIFFIPYGESAAADSQIVEVEASQFAWAIQPQTIEAGRPVEFRLTSTDVNHGFGVYDDHDVLLFQVQVIPGDVQEALYTFERPGTYKVLCLEYCGVAHHLMETTFEVTQP